jgi:hypothetical protein
MYKDIEALEKFKKEKQRNAKIIEPCLNFLVSIGKTTRASLTREERRIYNRIYTEKKKYGRDIFESGDYLKSDEEIQRQRFLRISKSKRKSQY